MKNTRRWFLVVLSLMVVTLVLYTLWDNNRIVINEQNIPLENLPSGLEGFSILQVADLHEKEFGKNQSRILKKINSLDYDAVVFTGDMVSDIESTNVAPFYTLLEGIENKENAYFVRGNEDPLSYDVSSEVEKSAFIRNIEKRGVTFLDSMDMIEVNEAIIRFVNFELAIVAGPEYIGKINGTVQPGYVTNEHYILYQQQLWKDMNINDIPSSDVVVAINHYPIVENRIDYIQNDPATIWSDFDLIIAGHYHGGQIRLPFIGALFVPEAWYEPNSFFPPQDRVKGLWEFEDTKQYVSAGLGSSDALPFLKFRLFNTPEINLLTLTGDK